MSQRSRPGSPDVEVFETTTDVVEEQLENGQLQLAEKANAKLKCGHIWVLFQKKKKFQQQVQDNALCSL